MRDRLRACLLGILLAGSVAAEDPKPLTEEECLAFARGLEEDAAKGDLGAAIARLDWDALLDRTTAGADADDSFVRGFRSGVKSVQRQRGQLFPTILEAVRKGGSYKLLRVHEKDGGKRALFRLLPPDGGVNYHDCMLARGRDGQVRAVDMYVFLSAENISATLRRGFLPAAADANKGFLEKLLTSESDFVKHLPEIQSISTHTREGRPAEALRVYRSLPASLRSDKNLLILRLMAAQAVGEEEYDAAFKDLSLCCPNDPCIDMFAIDAHIYRKRYDEALASVGRLEEAVGGDPYADVLRGNLHYMKGDRAASARFAAKAVAAEPTLQAAHWVLVQISLDERKFDETARLLIRIEKTFAMTLGDLKGIKEYEEFVQSAEYREWLEREK